MDVKVTSLLQCRVLDTYHLSSQEPSSRGFLQPCNASCGQVFGILTAFLSLGVLEMALFPDSSPPSPAWPVRNLPPPQIGSNQITKKVLRFKDECVELLVDIFVCVVIIMMYEM